VEAADVAVAVDDENGGVVHDLVGVDCRVRGDEVDVEAVQLRDRLAPLEADDRELVGGEPLHLEREQDFLGFGVSHDGPPT